MNLDSSSPMAREAVCAAGLLRTEASLSQRQREKGCFISAHTTAPRKAAEAAQSPGRRKTRHAQPLTTPVPTQRSTLLRRSRPQAAPGAQTAVRGVLVAHNLQLQSLDSCGTWHLSALCPSARTSSPGRGVSLPGSQEINTALGWAGCSPSTPV